MDITRRRIVMSDRGSVWAPNYLAIVAGRLGFGRGQAPIPPREGGG
ncbi:MAG TPA: hypothetical protein VGO86_08450 [Candidatus Dormibacteraeota bacterium]